LGSTRIHQHNLMPGLSNLGNLTILELSGCQNIDSPFNYITHLTQLNTLYLQRCPSKTTGPDFRKITELKNLKELYLESTLISENCVFLSECDSLEKLSMESCPLLVDDMVQKIITPLTRLSQLNLGYSNISDVSLVHVANLVKLVHLDLHCCYAISDIGMEILSHMANLTHLDISNLAITDEALANLNKLKLLRYLRFSSAQVDMTTMISLQLVLNLRQVEVPIDYWKNTTFIK